MHLEVRNVNDAFYTIVRGLESGDIPTVRTTSRAGDVLMVPEPMLITYERPRERVLFNAARDANPFFHLFESLWMLAGRNDVAPLAFYSSKIRDIASDDGRTFNGAYGYRWRHATVEFDSEARRVFLLELDQLNILIEHLHNKPDSRRAVLQMWNVEDDLLRIDVTKDVCCNTCVYFLIRREDNPRSPAAGADTNDEMRSFGIDVPYDRSYLDMTVCNRSNDAILGMLGANVVHFSILQEYVANALGVEVGVYNQFTNNLHVYVENYKPREWLDAYESKWGYPGLGPNLVENRKVFDEECARFVETHRHNDMHAYRNPGYSEPFLQLVAWPMCMAFLANKAKRRAVALEWVDRVEAPDWRKAGREWIERRIKNAGAKEVSDVGDQ